MGNRGKVAARQRARELRAEAWTLKDIADDLGVARSSVSLWVRDVDFEPEPRRRARKRGPNKLQQTKAAEIERFRVEGMEAIGTLTDREFLMAGLGLYAGDGAKKGEMVHFANSNPAMIGFYCAWLRKFFDVEESRLRVSLYLRAVVDETMRTNRHVHGCCHVRYSSASTHRRLMGLMNGLILVSFAPSDPG